MSNYKLFSRTEKSKNMSHKVNEDCFFCAEYKYMNDENIKALSVADGMGGLEDGEKASANAISGYHSAFQKALLKEYISSRNNDFSMSYHADRLQKIVRESIKAANETVCEEAEVQNTGSTISTVTIMENYAIVANVGDSPIYYYKTETEELILISKLHTLAEEDVEEGMYPRYSEAYYANDHKLCKSLGRYDELDDDDIYIRIVGNLKNGDMFLLGTDGAFGRLKEDEIENIIKGNRESLVLKYLFEQGRKVKNDDQTAILYRICEEVL